MRQKICMMGSVTLETGGWRVEACCTWGEDRGKFQTDRNLQTWEEIEEQMNGHREVHDRALEVLDCPVGRKWSSTEGSCAKGSRAKCSSIKDSSAEGSCAEGSCAEGSGTKGGSTRGSFAEWGRT
jgi:hypothetical protein